MNTPESEPALDPEWTQLVAYLDGELDADESERVEQRLQDDESFRQALSQMQQAWDLLDDLPRQEAPQDFTQTTIELVALSAQANVQTARRRWTWLGGLSLFAAVVAFMAGFQAVRQWSSAGNEQLLEDLPVIERVDEYRMVDNMEFVRALDEAGLFTEEAEDGGISP